MTGLGHCVGSVSESRPPKGAGTSSAASVSSVKPVLVSIGRIAPKSVSVVSIRSYVLDASGEQVSLTKVNASADVLRGPKLVRLSVQRVLTDQVASSRDYAYVRFDPIATEERTFQNRR
jgi:hypothetical protein